VSDPKGAARFSGNKSTDSTADALIEARRSSEAEGARSQDLNRGWWERLPMTYAEWSTQDRTPETRADFEMIRHALFGNSPFLRECYDFAGQKGRRVLDLGCGSGVTACVFAEIGADVTAADLTQAAVEITRRAAEAWGVSLRIARVDAEAMGFADGVFDHVFSWGVLHHTRDTEAAFREVTRVLEPGGTGLVMVYHKTSAIYYLKGLAHLFLKGKIFAGYNLKTVQHFFTDGYFHRHFTRTTLHRALTDSGLTVTRIVVTQMQKKILPGIPACLDRRLKSRFGWLIVAEFEKPVGERELGARQC